MARWFKLNQDDNANAARHREKEAMRWVCNLFYYIEKYEWVRTHTIAVHLALLLMFVCFYFANRSKLSGARYSNECDRFAFLVEKVHLPFLVVSFCCLLFIFCIDILCFVLWQVKSENNPAWTRACVFVWIFATARCHFYFIDVLMLLLPTGRCCWVLLLLLTFCTFLASMDLFVFRSFLARCLLSVALCKWFMWHQKSAYISK